jgi:hypothetical protein
MITGKVAPPAASQSTISAPHMEYLEARGVGLQVALDAGFYSVTAQQGAALIGMSAALPSGGLAIPYPRTSPPYVRIRIDDGRQRFMAPAGRPVRVYVPAFHCLDAGGPLVVVEGPVKALALAAQGFDAVGLGGTGTTLTPGADRRLNESWSEVPVGSRITVLLFDSNRTTNANVARDEARLAMALEQAGGSVWIAELPHQPSGEAWGPDDFLASNGVAAMSAVIATARPADPVKCVEAALAIKDKSERDDAILGILADKAIVVAVTERGFKATQQIRTLLKPSQHVIAFTHALRQAERWLRSAVSHTVSGPSAYAERDGRLHLVQSVEGNDKLLALTNFTARIERELVMDDGAETKTAFEIVGTLDNGRALDRIRISPETFAKQPWPLMFWGAGAIVHPGAHTRDHVCAAVQTMSEPTQARVYAHLGWREHAGELVYLHAGGAIGASDAEVAIDDKLSRYTFPETPGDVSGAVLASLSLLNITRTALGHVLLSAAFRAPLQHFLYADSTVWLYGPSGAMKSSVVAVLMSFFGAFDRETLPASWESTATALENLLFVAKDVVVVIDDFAPVSSDVSDKKRITATNILRSIGNQSSRSRSRADLTLRPNRPPRALVVGTGEDLPSGESVLARIYAVEIRRGDIDVNVLTSLQAAAPLLPHAMAGYIEYLRRNAPRIRTWAKHRFESLRTALHTSGCHLRAPAAIAHLSVGAELFAEYAESIGVFTAVDRADFCTASLAALMEGAKQQSQITADANPGKRFIEVLRSLLFQREVRLDKKKGSGDGAPNSAARTSDVQGALLADHADEADGRPSTFDGTRVGWRDDRYVYLDADAVYTVVASTLRTAGESMPVKPRTLWRRLHAMGVLVVEEADRCTVRRVLEPGVEMRILMMPKEVLFGDEDPPAPSTTPAGEDSSSPAAVGTALRSPGPTRGAPWIGSSKAVETGSDGRNGAPVSHVGAMKSVSLPVLPALPGNTHREVAKTEGVSSGPVPGALESRTNACISFSESGENGASGVVAARSLTSAEESEIAVAIEQCGEVAVHLDVTSADVRVASIRNVHLALPDGRLELVTGDALRAGRPIASALAAAEVSAANAVPTARLLDRYGISPRTFFDSTTAAQLLGNKGDYLAVNGPGADRLQQRGRSPVGAIDPAAAALAVATQQRLQLVDGGLARVAKIEFELIPVLVHMDRVGVPIDSLTFEAVTMAIADEARRLEASLKKALGVGDLSERLVLQALNRLGIAVRRTGKTALASYDHPITRDLAAFNSKSAFLRDLGPKVGRALRLSSDGRVRPAIHPMGAVTGRMSYSGPNLQGLPREPRIRSSVRAEAGRTFVIGDYSTVELRVAAHVARDEDLTQAFRMGADPHLLTAQRMTGKKLLADITKVERDGAKPINFGLLYGMSVDCLPLYSLVEFGIPMTLQEAARAHAAFQSIYPGLVKWQEAVKRDRSATAVNETGRRRDFSPSDAFTKRLNFPIQSLSADGMKRAMALVLPELAKYDAALILAVHDELILECPREAARDASDALRKCMETGMSELVTRVPIQVDIRIHDNWSK